MTVKDGRADRRDRQVSDQAAIRDVEGLLASVPTPTEEDMLARRQLARRYTLILLKDGPLAGTAGDGDEALHTAHLQHLTKLQDLGKLVLNGPIVGGGELRGVSLYAVGVDEACALAEADPKVRGGYFAIEALDWVAVPRRDE